MPLDGPRPGPHIAVMELTSDTWRPELGRVCQEVWAARGRVVLCVTGRAGSGKSTLGRALRKQGLPGFSPRRVAVIDDGVLSVPVLGVFNRRVRHRSKERDELAPFTPHLRGKHLIVYVASHPEIRLSRCDAVLLLRCADDTRRTRLLEREANGEHRFRVSLERPEDVVIAATHRFEMVTG